MCRGVIIAVGLAGLLLTACSGPGVTGPASPPPTNPTGPVGTLPSPTPEQAGSPSDPATADTAAPLNDFERRVIAVLTAVGVKQPAVIEHSVKAAMVAGEFESRAVLVHSYGPNSAQAPKDTTVVDRTTLPGRLPAAVIETTGFGNVVRFVCAGVGYDVASLDRGLDPGSGDTNHAKRVAGLMVQHLGCP